MSSRNSKNGIPKIPQSEIYLDFKSRADSFVASKLCRRKKAATSGTKVIHDCVWGTVMFYPWEIEIIDSQLFQRLRHINQLGLAVLTYPSAHHSRFEHTLGVVSVVSQMIASVTRHDSIGMSSEDQTIPPSHQRRLRLAALLHDIGHCFFSHLSESIYGSFEQMRQLKSEEPIFSGAQPHEILGFIIINTPSFISYFENEINYPFEEGESAEELLGEVGRMIVGAPVEARDGMRPAYLTEMINGQFDADALDYLRRDSYATGLALSYHIDRFLYKLRLADREGEDGIVERHLTVPVSGITTVEEMVFSKLMLTRYIYQHQKVLAVESLIGDMVTGMQKHGMLNHPCDFLAFCDSDIYSLACPSGNELLRPAISDWKVYDEGEVTVGNIVERVLSRDLPKKAIVINLANVKKAGGVDSPELVISGLVTALRSLQNLREEILSTARQFADELGTRRPEIFDIHISIPHIKMSKDYSRTHVLAYDGKFIPMLEAVDLNDWTRAFSGQSWCAYIFSDPDVLPIVSLASLKVLESHGIICRRDKIFSSLKESHLIEAAADKLGI